jgi:hypothetical protein
VFLSFETTKPLLINISKEMMVALRDTLNEWNRKESNDKNEGGKKQL